MIQNRPIDIRALVNAHPFITIERPPESWQPNADDEPFIRCFGELIAASLVRNGGDLARVTISLSNVVIESGVAGQMPAGEFLAVTAIGGGDWGPEVSRVPDRAARPFMVSADLEGAAVAAGARWGYSRKLREGRGSVTLLFTRRPAAA